MTKDPYETVQLNCADIVFRRSDGGVLQAIITGVDYAEVGLIRLFPLTHPDAFILVVDGDGNEIGVIDRVDELPHAVQIHLHHELRLRYVVPVVTHIRKISQEPGMWRWDIETDRGSMRMLLPNLHDHVQTVAEDRVLVHDLDGRRCEIRISLLDLHSRQQLKKVQ